MGNATILMALTATGASSPAMRTGILPAAVVLPMTKPSLPLRSPRCVRPPSCTRHPQGTSMSAVSFNGRTSGKLVCRANPRSRLCATKSGFVPAAAAKTSVTARSVAADRASYSPRSVAAPDVRTSGGVCSAAKVSRTCWLAIGAKTRAFADAVPR